MRKILTAFALVAIVSVCGAQSVSATGARAEKSPLVALKQKVGEVALFDWTAEKDRALLRERVEKVSGSVREGDLCGALNNLEIFNFHVARFARLGFMKDPADARELRSLADRAARRIGQRARSFGMDCPAR